MKRHLLVPNQLGLLVPLLLTFSMPLIAAEDVRWLAGEGTWQDASKWSHGVPDGFSTASIRGKSLVHVQASDRVMVAGMMRIGAAANEEVKLLIEGGKLVSRREFIQIGEAPDSKAEIILENGALHGVSSVYLGGAGNRTTDAATAYAEVLKNVGALPQSRDATDQRVVSEVRTGKGSIIDHAPKP